MNRPQASLYTREVSYNDGGIVYLPTNSKYTTLWIDALEMRAADEVPLVDAVYRASSRTLTAASAEGVIYGREVVDNLDSAILTGLLTLHTADTAVGAYLSCQGTLIVVGALNDNSGGVLDKVNDTVGTLSYTDTAANTLSRVNLSNAVLDEDSVLGTNNGTVAVAKAGKVTYLVTAVNHVSGKAGLVALVLELSFGNTAGAVTSNVSNLLYNVCRLNTEDGSNLLCGIVTAGNTKVGSLGSLFSKSFSVAVTAGEAAGAAVGAGQTLTDSYSSLVLLYRKEYSGKGEQSCAEYCNTEKKKHGE